MSTRRRRRGVWSPAGGLSLRGAQRILNFILDEMKQALARDEVVEFPLGWLTQVKKISPHWELIGDEPAPLRVESGPVRGLARDRMVPIGNLTEFSPGDLKKSA